MDGYLRFVFLTDITEEELTTQLMPELEDNGIYSVPMISNTP